MQIEIEEAIAIGSLIGGAMIWIAKSIIAPLSEQIKSLISSINRLQDTIAQEQSARHELEIRLTEVEARARSNTHRLDKIENVLQAEKGELIT